MDQTGIPGWRSPSCTAGRSSSPRATASARSASPTRSTPTRFSSSRRCPSRWRDGRRQEVGEGTVAWDTPIVTHLPDFALADPYVTQNVTIADMYSHRSGLPDHAADLLEDLGFDQQQIFDRLKFAAAQPVPGDLQLHQLRLTAGAESVAGAAGIDWATLSERDVYGPLGMTATSSRFADFQANPDRRRRARAGRTAATQAKYVREPTRSRRPAGSAPR